MLRSAVRIRIFTLAFRLFWRSRRGRAGRNAVRKRAVYWWSFDDPGVPAFATRSTTRFVDAPARRGLSRRPVFRLHLRTLTQNGE